MNLTDAHSFLVAWGNWVLAEYAKLSYSAPQYNSEYEAGYRHSPANHYLESDYEQADKSIKRLSAQDRAIIKGLYLDGRKSYFEKTFTKEQRDDALKHFLNEYQMMEVA